MNGTSMTELPDDGLTLPELAQLIPQLRGVGRGYISPLPRDPQDYASTYVTSATATVHLSDGTRLEIEIPEGRMRSRVNVARDVESEHIGSPVRPIFSTSLYTLSVALGDVTGWKVCVHEPEEGRLFSRDELNAMLDHPEWLP